MFTPQQKQEDIYYINGEFVPASEAKISVLDRCFLYGDGVFEGITVWKGVPFKLDEHVERMFKSMAYLRIESPVTLQEMKEAILETIRKNKMVDRYIRPQISRGEGLMAAWWQPDKLKGKANFVIIPSASITEKHKQYAGEKKGSRAIVVSTRRIPPCCLSSAAKITSYPNEILGAIEVANAGADIGIMLDTNGNVSEGLGYNIFIVEDGVLLTPTEKNILVGITRKTVIEIARREGYKVIEADFDVYHLYTADESFSTSSAQMILPIIEIDGRMIDRGEPGSITKRLTQLLYEEMDKEAEKFKEGINYLDIK